MSTLKKEYRHIPVMLDPILTFLKGQNNFLNGKVFVDCTLGGAGHSSYIAKELGPDGILIGIDQDTMALNAAKNKLDNIVGEHGPKLIFKHNNFSQLDDVLLSLNLPGVDAILMDLGMSSPQIDNAFRGFSFKEDCVLDMRMNPDEQKTSAIDILESYSEKDLANILWKYSDEKFSREIAREIIVERAQNKITKSSQLVDIIKRAIPAPARRKGGHPAKRTFQALRIEVNQELKVLEEGLDAAIRWLNPGGKLSVITYHSLEDKIVKSKFGSLVDRCNCPPDFPQCICGKKPILKLDKKKMILPKKEEIEFNPRARSAKLRNAIKI